jgi:chemotaxis protein MotB
VADSPKDGGTTRIIVRKHGGHGGHHGGAWKVAYADFVTAMMAFFLVMWIVAQSSAVKQGVAGYFKDPVGFSEKARSGLLDGGRGVLESDSAPAPEKKRSVGEEEARETLRRKAKEILDGLTTMPGFSDLAKQIDMEMTEEGLRINMMESSESTFFDVGNAKPSGAGAEALRTIGKVIGPLEYEIVLEGHTDSRPYASREGYTNWELSSDRANAARRVLEESGVKDERVTAVRGFADKRPRFPDKPADSKNRRITILVLNPYAKAGEKGVDASALVKEAEQTKVGG